MTELRRDKMMNKILLIALVLSVLFISGCVDEIHYKGLSEKSTVFIQDKFITSGHYGSPFYWVVINGTAYDVNVDSYEKVHVNTTMNISMKYDWENKIIITVYQ